MSMKAISLWGSARLMRADFPHQITIKSNRSLSVRHTGALPRVL
jgi:hypothetical protein